MASASIEEAGESEKGVRYPGDNLESALEMLQRIREAVGFGAASRDTLVTALGYRTVSGTSARKVGTLTHYGLLERAGNSTYRISDLAKRILLFKSAAEKREAIAEAAKNPTLFGALIEKYSGHALPTMLANLLHREHRVNPSVSDAAAKTFRETVEFAGLLRHGVLFSSTESPDAPGDQDDSHRVLAAEARQHAGDSPVLPSLDPLRATADSQVYTIALGNSGRLARIEVPLPFTDKDLSRIAAWIKYMSAVVEEEAPAISAN